MYFARLESDTTELLKQVLADVRAACVPSTVECAPSDSGPEFDGDFSDLTHEAEVHPCRQSSVQRGCRCSGCDERQGRRRLEKMLAVSTR